MDATADIARGSWAQLPSEIKFQILKHVKYVTYKYKDSQLGYPQRKGRSRHKLWRFANTCQEWRDFFERHTFKRLVLTEQSIITFDQVISRRKCRLEYIEHIILRVRLLSYSAAESKAEEDDLTIRKYVATGTI